MKLEMINNPQLTTHNLFPLNVWITCGRYSFRIGEISDCFYLGQPKAIRLKRECYLCDIKKSYRSQGSDKLYCCRAHWTKLP